MSAKTCHGKPGAVVRAPIVRSLLWGSGRWRWETHQKLIGHPAGSTQHRGKHTDPASSQVEGEDQRQLVLDLHTFTMPCVCVCLCMHACMCVRTHTHTPPKTNLLGRSQVQEVENEDSKQIFTLVCLSLQELKDHIIFCSQMHATHLARDTIMGKN